MSENVTPSHAVASEALIQRITSYLSLGGLWNPELAVHNAVRDLFIECRAALAIAPAPAPEQPIGHLHSNGEFCQDRTIASHGMTWPIPLYAGAAPSQETVPPWRYRDPWTLEKNYASPAPSPSPLTDAQIAGAVARGWCHSKNSHKVMDSDLALAISDEVRVMLAAAAPQPPQGEKP